MQTIETTSVGLSRKGFNRELGAYDIDERAGHRVAPGSGFWKGMAELDCDGK